MRYYCLIFIFFVAIGIITLQSTTYFSQSKVPCANSRTCKTDLSLQIDNDVLGIFQGRTVVPPKVDLAHDLPTNWVLGVESVSGEKHIYVNLETQTLYAMQGSSQVMKARVATGKWGRTPVGNFHIWTKLRSTRMSGGSGADAYNLPNVPYVMYFFNDFGLHGAYWHNNFGHEMSHGCVNLRIVDAKKLFEWADGPMTGEKGTEVSICNKFTAPNLCVQENPIN